MNVKSIFITLITVVACVMIGAFVLNVLMPNVIRTAINAVEIQLYNATGMELDFNGDGNGANNGQVGDTINASDADETGAGGGNVTGFQGGN